MLMKPHTSEIHEGPAAFERFRTAMKTIMSVKKRDVIPGKPKTRTKKKRPANHKG